MNLQLPITIDRIEVLVLIKRRGKWHEDTLAISERHLDGATMRFVAHKPMIVRKVNLYGPGNKTGPVGVIDVVTSPTAIIERGTTFTMELKL